MRVALALVAALAPLSAGARNTIVVAPFSSAAAADTWIAEGLSHGLSGRLYELPDTNVLTVRQSAAALRAYDEAPSDLGNAKLQARLMKELGASTLVTGKLKGKGDKLTLELLVIGRSGAPVKKSASGSRAALAAFEQAAAEQLKVVLAAPESFMAAGTTEVDAAWASLFEGVALLGKQSLSPRAADPSNPPSLTDEELLQLRGNFETAFAKDPKLAVAQSCLAVVLSLQGDAAAANAAAEAGKTGRGPLPALAATFVAMRGGDPERAMAILKQAVVDQPGFLHARGTLGQLYNHYGRFREAKGTFTAYIERCPEQPWARAQLGYTLAKQKKFDEALAATQEALKLAPDSPELLAELASRAIDAGRYDEAKTTLERALKASPNDARLMVRLGYVHLLREEDTLAIKHTEKALKLLDPNRQRKERAYAHLNLVRAWGHMGQFDVALEQLEQARRHGLQDCREVEADDRLVKLRADPRYQKARF